jgi:methanethiol S-methyltransferase
MSNDEYLEMSGAFPTAFRWTPSQPEGVPPVNFAVSQRLRYWPCVSHQPLLEDPIMKRIAFFAYGTFCHLLFLAIFAYMAGFVGNLVVPGGIDAPDAPFSWAGALVDTGLILLFGLQHSVMARPSFKRWWTRFIPSEIERSTYVLVSCLAMAAILIFWQPIGPIIWDVQGEIGRASLWALFATGWLMVPLVSLLINHFDLFGTRQVWLQLARRPYTQLPFGTPGIYRVVRHPLYVGWIIAFWATPTMSAGHLLFAGLMSLYMLAAIPLEESDLIDHFGEQYASYREQVPALVPRIAAAPKARAEVTA